READDIQLQLDHAAARLAETGEYADGDWYARAKHALRCRRRDIDKLNRQIKEAKREAAGTRHPTAADVTTRRLAREARMATFGQTFIDVAEEFLPRPLFDAIREEARKRHGEAA